MNTVLLNIDKELDLLAKAVVAVTSDVRPISIAHNNWQFPAVSIPEMAEQANLISRLIKLTRQVGQLFKLAEDYAFKASISRAYEGYRKEANRMTHLSRLSPTRRQAWRSDS
jgi:hypothetical protein